MLENRRLFAGGIDASFGSANGAAFSGPGDQPSIVDSAVDRYGRTVLAGKTTPNLTDTDSTVVLARLNADGVLDTNFGSGGMITGTPRGVREFTQVFALPERGYLATGRIGGAPDGGATASYRLIKFDDRGRIDTRFGREGYISLGQFRASQILRQPDGKFVLVGVDAALSDDVVDVTKRENYAIRLNVFGKFDPTFGVDGRVDLGVANLSIGGFTVQNNVTSASLDSSGRLLLAIENVESQRNSNQVLTSISTSTSLRRLSGNGLDDPRFVSRKFSLDTSSTNGSDFTTYSTTAITRPDGQIVLLQTPDDPAYPNTGYKLIGSNGQLVTSSGAGGGGFGGPFSFYVPNAADGSVIALPDNSLVFAGATIEGSARIPAMVKVPTDVPYDVNFGTNGLLKLPTTNGAEHASRLTVNVDGSLSVVTSALSDGTPTSGDLNVLRVFPNNKPVIALIGSRSNSGIARVTVSIRGINPIDATSIDGFDLRLTNLFGGRQKLKLIGVVDDGNGDVLATYQPAKTGGIFSLVSIAGQIEDTSDNANQGGVIGQIIVF